MKRKWLAVGIILLFVGVTIAPAMAQNNEKSQTAKGSWLYVGGSGPGNYTKIQAAIDHASNGDTVFVFSGIYYEDISIYKSLFVIGEDKNNTIIDGQYEIPGVVALLVNNIYISGFSIIHSRNWANDYGLLISSYDTVVNNIISDNKGGWGGICLEGDSNYINNNIICNNSDDGIFIRYTASYNMISKNTINHNRRGVWFGSCNNNIFTQNYICNNTWQGLWIAGAENNEISNNVIENNSADAVIIESDASNDIILGNIIKNNYAGVVIRDARSLIITMNSFYGEGIRCMGDTSEYWTSHTISGNIINEKPIYYYKFGEELIVPSDAGQVILASCTNSHINNLLISDVDYGIQLGFSLRNTISNNQFFNITATAIALTNSQENEIFSNRILNSNNGVYIDALSDFTNIHENIIKNNIGPGIHLQSSTNIINMNSFENNYAGVYIDFSDFNTITKNNFINNSDYQINYLVNYTLPKSNKFKQNYYENAGFFIKIIYGKVRTRFSWEPIPGGIVYIYRTGFIIDWFPAQEPYDIPGMD